MLPNHKSSQSFFHLIITSVFVISVLVLALSLSFTRPGEAQAPTPTPMPVSGPGPCVQTQCFGNQTPSCGANDVRITSFDTYQMIEPCRYANDTGTYIFKATFLSGASQRYDPTVWIAADGGNALTGICYRDYLNPITTGTANLLGGYGPFQNLESVATPADTCGDISQNNTAVKIIGPITITCTSTMFTTGKLPAIIGWGNTTSGNCTSGVCPDQTSKCNKDGA